MEYGLIYTHLLTMGIGVVGGIILARVSHVPRRQLPAAPRPDGTHFTISNYDRDAPGTLCFKGAISAIDFMSAMDTMAPHEREMVNKAQPSVHASLRVLAMVFERIAQAKRVRA